MKAVIHIKNYLNNIPPGKPFSSTEMRTFATTENIRQILGRLVKKGELIRVARGIFARPIHTLKNEGILPSPSEVAETLAESTGEIVTIHGAEAARQLQLTTQVPMRLIFYTSGNTRTLKIANRTVRLKHVNPSRLIAIGTIPGLVISALCYLGKENVKIETLEAIKNRIPLEEFNATVDLIRQMPAWLSDVFYHFQQKQKNEQ